MARPFRMESEAGVYHVINRGNYRADIFRTERAKTAFLHLSLIEDCISPRLDELKVLRVVEFRPLGCGEAR